MNLCRDCSEPVSGISPLADRCSRCHRLDRQQRRSRDSTKARRICFEAHSKVDADGKRYLVCHICATRLNPPHDSWRADHLRRWAEGGSDTAENLWPICLSCDEWKAPRDTRAVAKGKRAAQKHHGIRTAKRPMPGSRGSGWRKRMDGTVERRS